VLLVGGDNVNSLANSPSKRNREEKQEQPAVTTTTTTVATTTLSISSHNPENDLHVDDTATTTESFWTDSGNQDELHELQHANIRNASDARGIFSNIVKTLNRGKTTFFISFPSS